MSQMGRSTSGNPSMGDIKTLTGMIGGPVGPTLDNIDFTATSEFIVVSGNPGTSTITFILSNWSVTTGTTVGVGTLTIAFAVDEFEALTIETTLIGLAQDFSGAAGGHICATAYNDGSGAILVGQTTDFKNNILLLLPSIDVTAIGATLTITITGAPVNIDWKVVTRSTRI